MAGPPDIDSVSSKARPVPKNYVIIMEVCSVYNYLFWIVLAFVAVFGFLR